MRQPIPRHTVRRANASTRIAPLAAAVLVIAASSLTGATAFAEPPRTPVEQPVAVGHGGAVVSDTLESTQAGLEVLRRGGTAADAAVAVAATLGVTDPYVAGIGGGGYLVHYDARTGRVSTLDGRETTPAAGDAEMFLNPRTGEPLPRPAAITSGLSVGVPGTLATWERALQRWGRFSLARNLAPAIQVAERGFTVDAQIHWQTEVNQERFAQFSSTSALFLPDGDPPEIGSTLRNPHLARTYREIAEHGTSAFYNGPIGSDIVRTVRDLPLAPDATLEPRPGRMTTADLTAYRVLDRDPVHTRFLGTDVYGMAPSSGGGVAVGEALNILNAVDVSTLDEVGTLHHFLEASKLAFADRDRYVGDPAYVDVPLPTLLSPSFAASRACLIDPAVAQPGPVAPGELDGTGCTSPARPGSGPASGGAHTNHLVVADRWGNVVSYTNTIEELGGSGIVVPGRGFLLNNELTDFAFAPSQDDAPDPNLPAAGKRPRSSMAPTIVLLDGRPLLAVGSPGGPTIITTVLQVLLNRLHSGMDLPSAIAAPRAAQLNSPVTLTEPSFPDSPEGRRLTAMGHQFEVLTEYPLGVVAALEFLPDGRVLAAGEPHRRGGTSAGVVRPTCSRTDPPAWRAPRQTGSSAATGP